MDAEKILEVLQKEVADFLNAKDQREHLIDRFEEFFDEIIQPINLPGPDQVIDPLLRSSIRPLVGRVYDELTKEVDSNGD